MVMKRLWIIVIFLITTVLTVLVKNNAQVWPPTLLAYRFATEEEYICSENIRDYYLIGVGQNISINFTRFCLSNSPIGFVWTYPQLFNSSSLLSIILEAKIDHRQLILWYNKSKNIPIHLIPQSRILIKKIR